MADIVKAYLLPSHSHTGPKQHPGRTCQKVVPHAICSENAGFISSIEKPATTIQGLETTCNSGLSSMRSMPYRQIANSNLHILSCIIDTVLYMVDNVLIAEMIRPNRVSPVMPIQVTPLLCQSYWQKGSVSQTIYYYIDMCVPLRWNMKHMHFTTKKK